VGAGPADRDHAARPLAGDEGCRSGARRAPGSGRAAPRRGRARHHRRWNRNRPAQPAARRRRRARPPGRARPRRRRDRRWRSRVRRVDDHG
jgi:hypothetical protein